MQQLDLFGFPIESPAPKKKEKAVKPASAPDAPVSSEAKTVEAALPVAAVENVVTIAETAAVEAAAITGAAAPVEQAEPITIAAEINSPEIIPAEEPAPAIAKEKAPVIVAVEKITLTPPSPENIFATVPEIIETPSVGEIVAVEEDPATVETIQAETTPAAVEMVAVEETVATVKQVEPAPAPAKKAAAPVHKQAGKRGRKSFKEMDNEADLIEVPEDEILQQKLYYSISEVAGWFKVNTSLLRYWENEFDVLQPRKTRKGDRLFRVEDIKNLQLIYFLLRQRKFSIDGAKNYLKNNKQEADTQVRLVESLTRFRSFLLEMKANLQA